jgi:four helix bundle protein
MFNFRRLDVYGCAIAFFKLSALLAERTPSGYHSLADQLRRAAVSIPLNIAEGSGRFDKDERRYFAMARGSALECAAIIDVLEALGTLCEEEADQARELLERIVSMLTKLCVAR